jgi:hypothetical protein
VKVGGREAGSGIVSLEIAGGRARPLGETTASSVFVAEGEEKP